MSSTSSWPQATGEMADRIRAFDWSQTPLGPIEGWSVALRTSVGFMLEARQPVFLGWGPDAISLYNDSIVPILGTKHPAGLGRPYQEIFAEVWEDYEPILARTMAGEAHYLEDQLIRLAGRSDHDLSYFTYSWTPVREVDGTVAGFLSVATETTEKMRSLDALRESTERQTYLLQLADALRPIADPVAVQEVAAQTLGMQLQVDRCYYAEFDWPRDVLHIYHEYVGSASFSVVGSHPISLFQDLLQFSHKGEPLVCDNIANHPIFRSEIAAYRERGTDGFILVPLVKKGVMVACMCVTMATPRAWSSAEVELVREVAERTWAAVERARAEAALTESEELFRSFAENSTDTLWIVNAETGTIDYLSPAFAAMYGEDPKRVAADLGRFLDLVHPDDRDRVVAAMPTLFASGATNQVEYRVRRPGDGTVRWIQDTGFPIRDATGRIARAGGIAQDVTDRREAEGMLRDSEAQLQLMVAELHHRTRNLIGVVTILMRQILASSTSLADFRVRFTERLEALSRVQGLFSARRGQPIGIHDIVRIELDGLGVDFSSDRVSVDGAPVELRKSAVQTLALAIHELATNARKYGALVGDAGELVVRWTACETETGQRRLRFEWTETGIDRTVEETEGTLHKGGYGRKLIEEALPYTLRAKTSYALGNDRLDCTIDLPLD